MFDLWYSSEAPTLIINGVYTDGIPEYPSVEVFPPNTDVPLPDIVTLKWSEPHSLGFNWPASFSEYITVPNARQNPVLHAAAVEAIRVANGTFKIFAPYEEPTTYPGKKLIDEVVSEFRAEYWDQDKFPNPPDMRILFLREDGNRPCYVYESDGVTVLPNYQRLWVIACQEFNTLNEENGLSPKNIEENLKIKEGLLKATFKTYQNDDQVTDIKKWDSFVLGAFKRYLAHLELAAAKEQSADWQPSAEELGRFFSSPENEGGSSLADLHRTFYNVRNIPELIRRVERFATYTRQPPVLGRDYADESVFNPKPQPTVSKIKGLLATTPLTIPELLEQLSNCSELTFLKTLKGIAAPDMTTGRWLLKTTPSPTVSTLWGSMGHDSWSTRDMIAKFPDQVWSRERFCNQLAKVAYFDEETMRWWRLEVDSEKVTLPELESRKIRGLRALVEQDPLVVLASVEDMMEWDAEAGEFARKLAPQSPKRKRNVEDRGEEDAGEEKAPPARAIKKPRTRVERCASPQQQ